MNANASDRPEGTPAPTTRGRGAGWTAALAAALAVSGCGGLKLPSPLAPPDLARVNERSPGFTVTRTDAGGTYLGEVSSRDFHGRALVVVAAAPRYFTDGVDWLRLVASVAGAAGSKGEGRYDLVVVVEGNLVEAADCASLLPEGTLLCADLQGIRWMRAWREAAKWRRSAERVRAEESDRAEKMDRKAEKIEEELRTGGAEGELPGTQSGSGGAGGKLPGTQSGSDGAGRKLPGLREAFGFVGEGPLAALVGPDGTLVALLDGPPDGGRGKAFAAALLSFPH